MVDIQRLQALITELHEQNYLYILCYDSAEFYPAIYRPITKPINIVQRVMSYVKVDLERQERLLALIKQRFPKLYQKHFPPKKLDAFELEQLQDDISHLQDLIKKKIRRIRYIENKIDLEPHIDEQDRLQGVIDKLESEKEGLQAKLKQKQEKLMVGYE